MCLSVRTHIIVFPHPLTYKPNSIHISCKKPRDFKFIKIFCDFSNHITILISHSHIFILNYVAYMIDLNVILII